METAANPQVESAVVELTGTTVRDEIGARGLVNVDEGSAYIAIVVGPAAPK